MRFDGKVSVVTGGASGIGEGIVRRLVAEGGRCLIADVQEDRGRALTRELGEAVRFMRADVSVEADVAALVDAAVSELGGLDCLFNNAGILGVFGGFDDGLGQGVYRGDYHVEGEVWDVSHPTQITDASGRTFEFDHAWAENFTRLTSDGRAGLAHFECVVITEPQEWSARQGRTTADA
jgi:NAD(P)-dependent dehydrogenase (short-subunit alcohol dehydrogenase family)